MLDERVGREGFAKSEGGETVLTEDVVEGLFDCTVGVSALIKLDIEGGRVAHWSCLGRRAVLQSC